MKFWFAVPLAMLMLSPMWFDSLYEPGGKGRGFSRDEGGIGIPERGTAEGGIGIPEGRFAEGGIGIPEGRFAEGGIGIPQ